ncbi:MAG: inverse autotransporter beta domain-containing protein, partial [Alphaproteobacteria bacterium]|nr:inverse autotransporter beta domain-containing protein [Alphaproteobacteria bacterium]
MKKGLIKKLIWLIILHILWKEYGTAAQTETSTLLYSQPKWNPEARFRFAATTRRSLGQVDLFVPLTQDNTSLFFLDLRFWRDTKNTTEGNYGLAYRKLCPSLGWVFGGYGFFDNRQTKHNNTFQQATFGIEALSELWDFRANTYVPFSKSQKLSSSQRRYTYRGHEEFTLSPKEVALKGVDVEIGRLVPGTDNLRFYVSGFHFERSGVRQINGGMARLMWTVNRYIDLEADYRYDNVRHSTPIFW